MRRNMHQRVKDNDTLQGRTQREDATCLVVLLLFTNKQETDLGIVDHELYLLFRRGSIERNGDGTNTPGTEVTLNVLYGVL